METSQLQSLLTDLWQQLGANPRNRALAIANILAHRDDQRTRELFTDLIARCTPPSQERDDALRLLDQSSPFSPIQIVPDELPKELRTDPELGRLTVGLYCAAEFRLWIIGRELTRAASGSGVVSKKALRDRVAAYGIHYTPRHYNRLLKAGNGLFWTIHDQTIYLRSIVKVACDVMQKAEEHNLYIDTNRPGVREVYLDVSGSLEQWEAMLYAGFVTHRSYSKDLVISRETQAVLFNRHENTIRRWEENRLKNIIVKRTNYAQCPDIERYYDAIPDHVQPYVARIYFRNQVEDVVRLRWQLPNSYHTTLRDHPKRGQAAKVRKAVNAMLPAAEQRGGYLLRYLSSPHKLKRLYRSRKFRMGLLGDADRPLYVFIGEHYRTKSGMWEITNSGWTFTHPNERLAAIREQAYFDRQQEQREARMREKEAY